MLIDTDKLHELLVVNRRHANGDEKVLRSADRFASALYVVEQVAQRTGLVERARVVVHAGGVEVLLSKDEVEVARRFTMKK